MVILDLWSEAITPSNVVLGPWTLTKWYMGLLLSSFGDGADMFEFARKHRGRNQYNFFMYLKGDP